MSVAGLMREDGAGARAAAVLECRGIRKSFPGVLALDNVDLAIRPREIHALVGQNGAGKSTLVKILTGVYAPTAGSMLVEGQAMRFANPAEAEAAGIVIVHQDQPMVGQFDVTRNVFLGRELLSAGLLDFPRMHALAGEALRRVGATFPATTLVRDLTVAQRALAAIAAALTRSPRILILDEPTASLSDAEAAQLFTILRGLRDDGVTIIYISHYLDEVFELVDRITVLRDGRLVATTPAEETTRQAVIDAMVGRSLAQLYPKEALPLGDAALSVSNLSQGQKLRDISFTVRRGEILGIAGLVGAGRTELALALMGDAPHAGAVQVFGRPSAPASPRAAKADGFALIPEDRRHEGLVTDLTVRENLSLPGIARFGRFGLLDRRAERRWTADLIQRLKIVPPNPNQITRNLSGGNQQKIVIGRWLTETSKVFIFDEPTTGVDVGSKVEIYRQMTEVARGGAGVIFISSDFEELVGMCDRIAVMRKGSLVSTRPAAEVDVAKLMDLATSRDTATAGSEGTPEARRRQHLAALLTRWGTVIGMLIVLAAIGIANPDFLAPKNIFDVLKQGSLLAFIALGLTAALVAGGFDMSAGAVSQFATNLASGTIGGGLGMAAGIGLGLAEGVAAGAFNALLVLLLRIPPFVATLGTMFVAMGLSLLYNHGQALTLYNQPAFFFIGQGYIGPLPFVFLLLVIVVGLLHLFFKHSRAGLRMYAVGENLPAALLRGVSRPRAVLTSFLTAGLVLGFAGVVLASYSYGASALSTGLDFLISALAAAFLGSSLSRTGELSMIGTAIAAVFLSALSNGLVVLGISNLALPGLQGLVLVLSILLGVIHKRGIGQVLIF